MELSRNLTRALFAAGCLAAGWLVSPSPAQAKPIGPALFCDQYPASPLCGAGEVACTTCHVNPPERNVYGAAIEANLLPGVPRPLSDSDYSLWLPEALELAENVDSDGDGFTNIQEITEGTHPADALSLPAGTVCVNGNPDWDVCGFDRRYAFTKISLDFCGFSPAFEELEYFSSLTELQQDAALDDSLDVCLDTPFWMGKDGVLWDLAHRKIRPLGTLQQAAVDYENDYNLFTWSQTDGHDARDVLTANFFVTRNDTAVPPIYSYAADLPQTESVDVAHRAGLLTSRWTLFYSVMFSAVPRTAAAQAYRAFLGTDIARMEGLYPIANEPVDYDAKGVSQSQCALCHSTLDPLTYPFRNYQGLGAGAPAVQYVPARLETYFASEAPNIGATPEAGYIFGQPVANLQQWAQTAANSTQFSDATVGDYWKLLMGRPPLPNEQAEFQSVSTGFRTTDDYAVEKMLHHLIKTEAYGAP